MANFKTCTEEELMQKLSVIKFVVEPRSNNCVYELGKDVTAEDMIRAVARIIGVGYDLVKTTANPEEAERVYRETLKRSLQDPRFWNPELMHKLN